MKNTFRLQRRRANRKAAPFLLPAMCLLGIAMPGCPGTATNQPPVAVDQSVTTAFETAVDIVLAATDADGDTLTFMIISLPSSGTLTDPLGGEITTVPYVPTDGRDTVTFTPSSGFSGEVSFDFRANDGTEVGDAGTVTIMVEASSAGDVIGEDTTVAMLRIEADAETRLENGAKLTVTGDAEIDGTLSAANGLLVLEVAGDLTINGTLRAMHSDSPELMDDVPFSDQPVGIYIIVGDGEVMLGVEAVLETNGNVVITDDSTVLEGTPGDAFDDVEDVSGDDLPTLVPLPPDNDAFDGGDAKFAQPRVLQPASLPPVTVMGTWPPAGAPAPPGDKPVWIFKFDGERDLVLNNWTVNGPGAPDGDSDDTTGNDGANATGRSGRNGLRLNIFNNGGAINITNTVTFNLADGGPGGSATAKCASATGGDGGKSGNFRMTARNGISLTGGMLIINPGKSGDGGAATVTKGAAGAAGCPGAMGAPGDATGGNGADNNKRIFVRGNVTGLANLTIGDLIAGDGGEAAVEACDGGPGIACCAGGPGGMATAAGGAAGSASLNVGGLPINTSDVLGGDGGEATATGGNGGSGGDCKFGDAGDGGPGGAAMATGGSGGTASNNGSGTSVGGDSGPATAAGGNGGPGGDSGFGSPGMGGDPGDGKADTGDVGTGASDGTAGDTDGNPGNPGGPGGTLATSVYCIPMPGFVMDLPEGPIPPGMRQGPVNDETNTNPIGDITIDLPDLENENYQKATNPVDHIGIGNGYVEISVSSLNLASREAGVIGGLRIATLSSFGDLIVNPMRVQALDADGEVIGEQEIQIVPDNLSDPDNPKDVEVTFDVAESVDRFRIVVADGTFVTFLRIYLLDP